MAALVKEARSTPSWARFDELTRKIALLLSEERYEAGPVEAQDVYFRQVGVIPLLPASHERILFERMEAGDTEEARQIRHELIESHLRLVNAIARELRGRGLPFMDLIQEGNIGLEKAVDRFDPKKGNRLSTYAIWSIRSSILRAIENKARAIRVPASVQAKLIRIARAERRFSVEPTIEALSRETRIPAAEIEWLKRHTTPPVSLEGLEGKRDGEERRSVVQDAAPSPEEEVIENEMQRKLREAMPHLPPRQRQVLELRFGFGLAPHSLEEIGTMLQLSRERVRQIEGEALKRLRSLLGAEA